MPSMNEQWRNAIKEDILKERLLLVTSENKALKSEVEYLKLKMEAMEIIEKMMKDQINLLEKRNKDFLEMMKINQSSTSQLLSKGVV